MTEIKFTLETITPLFLGGAEPRGIPELRAASFRGALRFWLRALLGGMIGDAAKKLDDLRKVEADVFGSTDIGASAVTVRIQYGSLETKPFSQMAEWRDATRQFGKPGIAYLFFAARKTGSEAERNALSAGTSFELSLSQRSGAGENNEKALQQACAALWLLTHLGGLAPIFASL